MARKTYSVSLDFEQTEFLKEKLEKQGATLSGFVRAAIAEFFENYQVMGGKEFKDMTAPELMQAFQTFITNLQESGSEEKEAEIEKKLKEK